MEKETIFQRISRRATHLLLTQGKHLAAEFLRLLADELEEEQGILEPEYQIDDDDNTDDPDKDDE